MKNKSKKTTQKKRKTIIISQSPKSSGRQIWLFAGVAILVIVVMATMIIVLLKDDGSDGGKSAKATTFMPFIVIWSAVYIPFLANRNREKINKKEQKTMTIMVGMLIGLILLITGLGLYLYLRY